MPIQAKVKLTPSIRSNSKRPPGQIQVAITLWASPIYILTLFRGAYLGPNAKFLLTLTNKNCCAYRYRHIKKQSTPKIHEMLCFHLHSLQFPLQESTSDYPTTVSQVLLLFRMMRLSLNGQADQRLAYNLPPYSL